MTAKTLTVRVILLVAIDTFLACFGKLRRQMTLLAGHDRVQADQREARHIVLETDLFCPSLLAMTATTLFTLLAGMHICHTMTVNTAGPELFMDSLAAMTGRTGYLLVTTA